MFVENWTAFIANHLCFVSPCNLGYMVSGFSVFPPHKHRLDNDVFGGFHLVHMFLILCLFHGLERQRFYLSVAHWISNLERLTLCNKRCGFLTSLMVVAIHWMLFLLCGFVLFSSSK